MQTDRLVNLVEHKGAMKLLVGRRQRLRAAGDFDRVRLNHPDALQQLPPDHLKAIIEATHHRCVAMIFLPGRIEVKYFAHYLDRIATNSFVYVLAASMFPVRTFSSETDRTFF